jgi:hypothetical protein
MSRGKTADRRRKPKGHCPGRGVNFPVRRKYFFTGQEPYMDDPIFPRLTSVPIEHGITKIDSPSDEYGVLEIPREVIR